MNEAQMLHDPRYTPFQVLLDGERLSQPWDGFYCDRKRQQMYLILDGRRVYVYGKVTQTPTNPFWDAATRTLDLTTVK